MKLVGLLLSQDLVAARFWFKKNTLSRALVALSFLTICLSVSVFIYLISKNFFIYLKEFDQFGMLTVEYLVTAAIVVTCWFSLMASLISMYGFLTQSTKETEFLLSLPVPPTIIPIAHFIRTAVIDIFLFLIVFLPVVTGYQQIFLSQWSLVFLGRFLVMILFLVLILNSLASWLAYKTVVWFRRPGPLTGLLILAIFFGGLFVLLKIIFPSQIYFLLEADINQFFKIFYRLPLTQGWLPVYWVTSSILYGWSIDSLLFIVLTISVLILSFPTQVINFLKLYQNLHPKIHLRLSKQPINNFFWNHPLVYKDYLSIVRQPTETGYLFFLLGIGFFFFLLLNLNVSSQSQLVVNWQSQLTVFSFIWLLFFVTAYCLRLVYPLMAREGVSRWYIFSLPISKKAILLEKLKFSFILSLPLVIFSIVLWWIFPIFKIKLVLIIVSSLSIIFLAMINLLSGAVFPDFDQGDYPEKVTTSGMGIITLLIAFIYSSIVSFLLWLRLQAEINNFTFIILLLFLMVSGLIFSYRIAYRKLNQYRL